MDRAELKYWMDSFDSSHQKNLKAVTDAVKAHAEAQQRYKAVVDGILGPQREFDYSLKVINSLFEKGTISVEQYTAALKKLSQADLTSAQALGILTSAHGGKGVMQSELTGDAAWENAHGGFEHDMNLPDSPGNINDQIKAQEEKEKALLKMRQDYTKAWIDEMEKAKKASEEMNDKIAAGFGQLGQSIAEMALDGKTSVNDMLRKISAQMLSFMMSAAVKGFINMLTGGGGGFIGGVTKGGSLPGFASGGLIPPGGSGGTDSQTIAFRKSPDETVRITTPPQEAAVQAAVRGGGGGAQGGVSIHNHLDGASIVGTFLRSPEGERMIANTVSRHAPAIRGRTDGR
jgi:hypothetical protein